MTAVVFSFGNFLISPFLPIGGKTILTIAGWVSFTTAEVLNLALLLINLLWR